MISVIIPLYNKEPIIERTLKSVLSQDFDDYEVIIVDDGSTDKSVKIVENLLKLLKPLKPVKLVSQSNGGPSKARNTGVKHAKGEWILFLDADDELLPGALKGFEDLIQENPDTDMFVCGFKVRSINGEIQTLSTSKGYIKNPFKEHFYNRLVPHTGSTMIQRKMCKNNPFNEEIRRFEDFELWFRLYNVAQIYSTDTCSFILNAKYSEASDTRSDINDDFIGHLNFKEKPFWEKMCLYQLFIGERTRYTQCKEMYKHLNRRYDLFLLYKLLNWVKI